MHTFDYLFENWQRLNLHTIPHWNSDDFTFRKNISFADDFNKIEKDKFFVSWFTYENYQSMSDFDYMDWKVIKNASDWCGSCEDAEKQELVQWLGKINDRIVKKDFLNFEESRILSFLSSKDDQINLNGYCNLKSGYATSVKINGNKNRVFCGDYSHVIEEGNGSHITVGKNSVIFTKRIYNQQDTLYRQVCDTLCSHGVRYEKPSFEGEMPYTCIRPPRPDWMYHYPLIVNLQEGSSVIVDSHNKYLTFKVGNDLEVGVDYKFNMVTDSFERI